MTAMRASFWSAVYAVRPSGERTIRLILDATGTTARRDRVVRSRMLTLPGSTLAVQATVASAEIASMCDWCAPVSIVATTSSETGSMTRMPLRDSAVR